MYKKFLLQNLSIVIMKNNIIFLYTTDRHDAHIDETAFIPPRTDPNDQRPILVIPDSRGRIRTWHCLRSLPYWRHFVALCSKSTPQDYLQYIKERHIDYIITGDDHVDLKMALEELYS